MRLMTIMRPVRGVDAAATAFAFALALPGIITPPAEAQPADGVTAEASPVVLVDDSHGRRVHRIVENWVQAGGRDDLPTRRSRPIRSRCGGCWRCG